MKKALIFFCLLLLALAGCAPALHETTPRYAPGVSVIFDADAGRFVSFDVDGNSYFWKNPAPTPDPRTGWVDFGGDKIWPLPQAQWRKYLGRVWPPGKDLEGIPWQRLDHPAAQTHIARAGITLLRAWYPTFPDKGFQVETTLERTSQTIQAPVHIWGIAQVPVGEFGLISLSPQHAGLTQLMWFGDGRQACQVVSDDQNRPAALIVRPGPKGGKVGAMGQWVAAVYPKHILVRFLNQPAAIGADYADRSSVQLFQTREYWELETLSPLQTLAPGQQMMLAETWVVWNRPRHLTPSQLALWIDGKTKAMK